MKKASLLLMLFGEIKRRLSSFQVLRNLLFRPKEVVSSIDIHGDKLFCEVVKRALLLLKEEDLPTFNLIDRHLNLIIQSEDTLLDPHRGGAALGLDEKGLGSNPTWLACYAHRAKLYKDYVNRVGHSFKVPNSAYQGTETWDFMYECLRKVGGSYEELNHLKDFIEKEQEKAESN